MISPSDLIFPCLFVGSQPGLVVLAANPGWDPKLNALEDAYCRKSPEQYEDLLFNFFDVHPRVIGRRVRWWSGPMSFMPILDGAQEHPPRSTSGAARWRTMHASRLLGGWKLFPRHSARDGLTAFATKESWLHDFYRESTLAALRMRPQVLLVTSKSGHELMRHDLLTELAWHGLETAAPGRSPSRRSAHLERNREDAHRSDRLSPPDRACRERPRCFPQPPERSTCSSVSLDRIENLPNEIVLLLVPHRRHPPLNKQTGPRKLPECSIRAAGHRRGQKREEESELNKLTGRGMGPLIVRLTYTPPIEPLLTECRSLTT